MRRQSERGTIVAARDAFNESRRFTLMRTVNCPQPRPNRIGLDYHLHDFIAKIHVATTASALSRSDLTSVFHVLNKYTSIPYNCKTQKGTRRMPSRVDQNKWISAAADRDLATAAQIELFMEQLAPYIHKAPLPLFPEYTDHSINHVSDILETCWEISSADRDSAISREDYLVLALAAAFHDLGMHLTTESFARLIHPDNQQRVLYDNQAPAWSDLWHQFLLQARRFDSDTLKKLFGEIRPIRIPPLDTKEWLLNDRLLAGEFVRRHHGRLAHELCVIGWLLPDGSRQTIGSGISKEMRDIVGLIGRSHSFPVRSSFDYINTHYHLREYQRIHIAYLMCLLRISDYLQIQPERADVRIAELTRIYSPLSTLEWRVHQSVKNITRQESDPESIFVQAMPTDVRQFLRLRSWLRGIQEELDLSWAVLGELYGRFDLKRLSFALRRVRSNVDNPDEFQRHVGYLARQLRFTTATNELLKLLVRPLYHDSYIAGLRELIQNAADAVREHAVISGRERRSFEPRINVSFTIDSGKVTSIVVADNGTGMDADILENYYLRVGASFRASENWKARFAPSGQSTVTRTGRFGIGGLAAFILGDVLEVRTRHFLSKTNQALYFLASIDDPALSVLITDKSDGTEVAIKTDIPVEFFKIEQVKGIYTSNALSTLFCPEDLKLSIEILSGPDRRQLAISSPVPCRAGSKLDGWQELALEGNASCFITLWRQDGCWLNGIFISMIQLGGRIISSTRDVFNTDEIFDCALAFVDPDSAMAVDLQRTTLTVSGGDVETILDAAIKQKIFYLTLDFDRLLRSICFEGVGVDELRSSGLNRDRWLSTLRNMGLADKRFVSYPFLLTSKGIVPSVTKEDFLRYDGVILLYRVAGMETQIPKQVHKLLDNFAIKYFVIKNPHNTSGDFLASLMYTKAYSIGDSAYLPVEQFIISDRIFQEAMTHKRLERESVIGQREKVSRWSKAELKNKKLFDAIAKLVAKGALLGAVHLGTTLAAQRVESNVSAPAPVAEEPDAVDEESDVEEDNYAPPPSTKRNEYLLRFRRVWSECFRDDVFGHQSPFQFTDSLVPLREKYSNAISAVRERDIHPPTGGDPQETIAKQVPSGKSQYIPRPANRYTTRHRPRPK